MKKLCRECGKEKPWCICKKPDYHVLPSNDADMRGIYEYLAWKFANSGFSSSCFHYLEVLYKEAIAARR